MMIATIHDNVHTRVFVNIKNNRVELNNNSIVNNYNNGASEDFGTIH